jgi:Ca2+-binding EF-hand superfamily protein
MRRLLYLVPLLLGLPGLTWSAAPPVRDLRPVPEDAHDLILLHPARPFRLRFHLQVEGRSFQEGWKDTASHLFRFLDSRGAGELTRTDVAHAPSIRQWQQLRRGARAIEPDAGPKYADLAEASGRVTRQSLAAWYSAAGGGPLQVECGFRSAPNNVLSDVLFRALDLNKDGRLTREELLAAPQTLGRLDSNGDEMITPFKLGTGSDPSPITVQGVAHGLASGGLPFFFFLPGAPVRPLVDKLLERYDRDENGRLSQAECGLPPAVFQRLDRNKDGLLDREELAGWVELTPDLELILALDQPTRPATVMPGTDPEVRITTSPGSVALDLRNTCLEVVWRHDRYGKRPGPGGGAEPGGRLAARKALLARFRALDTNKDGMLSEDEVYQPPFDMVALSRLADRNGDGRISLAEFEAFLDLQENINASATFIGLTDRGRNLFALLDVDQDGRLGPREMRSAWARLAPWGTSFTRDSLPNLYRLTISSGVPLPDALTGPALMRPRAGPLWFSRMDRNGDGDVSRAEWLGTEEQFRKIDLDGDGLIDVEEAWKADAWFRKGARR